MEINRDGGGAFPQPDKASFELFSGISTRDYFAAKAMQQIIHSYFNEEGHENEHIAAMSYAMADAMLAERLK